MSKTTILQCLEIVAGDKGDLSIYGQDYNIPKSGVTDIIDNCGSRYKYDFSKKELVLLTDDNKEVIRKGIDPESFAKNEYKWIRVAKEEARIKLGLDEY